jgi:SAM-dependent methyltransferase
MEEHSVIRPENIHPGHSTAYGGNVEYRLGKLTRLGLIRGVWLDCGCAEGHYTLGLLRHGASKAVGTDISEEWLQNARRLCASEPRASFTIAAAEAMPFADGCFDGILLNEVLEHVEDERRTLVEMHRLLRPGGHLALFSPNRWFPFEGHGLIGPVRMPFPVPLVPWLPAPLTARWMQARNYWPRQLRECVASADFEVLYVAFAWPLFGQYRWLPKRVIRVYRKVLPFLERAPLIRQFGVSTLIIGQKASRRSRSSSTHGARGHPLRQP